MHVFDPFHPCVSVYLLPPLPPTDSQIRVTPYTSYPKDSFGHGQPYGTARPAQNGAPQARQPARVFFRVLAPYVSVALMAHAQMSIYRFPTADSVPTQRVTVNSILGDYSTAATCASAGLPTSLNGFHASSQFDGPPKRLLLLLSLAASRFAHGCPVSLFPQFRRRVRIEPLPRPTRCQACTR